MAHAGAFSFAGLPPLQVSPAPGAEIKHRAFIATLGCQAVANPNVAGLSCSDIYGGHAIQSAPGFVIDIPNHHWTTTLPTTLNLPFHLLDSLST